MSDELVVEKVVPGGRGFARAADGRPVLISGAFPGERVRLRLVKDRGSYLEATGELVGAGAEPGSVEDSSGPVSRVSRPCEVADACGGCDWMAASLEDQRRWKLDLVREALRRTGGLHESPPLELVSAGAPWGYRTRVRLQIQGGRVGFYASGSHELVEPRPCRVSAPALQNALEILRERVRDEPRAFAPFAHVELRAVPGRQEVSLFFGPRGRAAGLAALPSATQRALAALRSTFVVRVDGDLIHATERFPLEDCYLLAAPGTFTQVNWEVNLALVRAVRDEARRRGLRSFADLYCGSGNFSLPLAAAGLTGQGVEGNDASIACARRAAHEQGFERVSFHVGDVARVAAGWAKAGQTFDLVIVDPPRAGAKGALDAITRLTTRAVAMISCDPVTLARDLRGLLERGFRLERLLAFDMFPQTHHVECLAWLSPGPASDRAHAS
jgi:23S rRNA (uracil1939-C5)-methyltransferase